MPHLLGITSVLSALQDAIVNKKGRKYLADSGKNSDSEELTGKTDRKDIQEGRIRGTERKHTDEALTTAQWVSRRESTRMPLSH